MTGGRDEIGDHSGLGRRISEVLDIDPVAPAIEQGGRWFSWGEIATTARQICAAVPAADAEVGVILRNRPESIAAVLGVLMAGACVVSINPSRGADRTREDVAELDLHLLVGGREDIEFFADGSVPTIALGTPGDEVTISKSAISSPVGSQRGGVAVRMLTSGTTGPPKRIDLTYETFRRVLVGAKHYESDKSERRTLRSGVAIVNAPLAHVGGMFRVLQCVTDGRRFALLEKFTVEAWLDAVKRHRPKTTSLVPAALRMVLDADVDPTDLASLKSVISGTAPLDPNDADAFFNKYGVPVLISYGATEFAGGVAGWNLRDHQQYWQSKKGSVGRAHAGCALRVVDAQTGAPVPAGEEGILHVKASQLPDQGWIPTTDLARLDEDGFLWILGRSDQAIIRGGFKIIPDTVRAALESHPSVRGAAVVGRQDRRLGEVPVAAVDLWPDSAPVSPTDLSDHLSARLARYELPAEICIVEELPRTESGKADLRAVESLLASDSKG